MRFASHGQWQLRGAALLIFLLGMSAGALLLNVYHKRQAHQASRRVHFEQRLTELNLTAEQKTQVEQILRDARTRLREIRGETQPKITEVRTQTDARLKAVLTPQQWEQFQQLFPARSGKRRRP
jgi:Spy/CpxP family protein refolding chaperone